MRNVIVDAQGPTEDSEAFVVCDDRFVELLRADGVGAFQLYCVWKDTRVWCFSLPDLRRKRPWHFVYTPLYSVLSLARERGYPGPESVAAVAEWAAVPTHGTIAPLHDPQALCSPLGRCQLVAAILRAPRMASPEKG